MVCLNRLHHFKFFKGFLSQISLGPFFSTLSQILVHLETSAIQKSNKINVTSLRRAASTEHEHVKTNIPLMFSKLKAENYLSTEFVKIKVSKFGFI